MAIRFFNTLSARKEEFVPLEKNTVRMYTCGPTVYDFAHIGNFRAYVFEDVLRRFFQYRGYRVTQVMNLTDIDDKTIKGANARKVGLDEYTRPYIDAFFEDLDALGIERAEHYPRATGHIPEMVALVKRLRQAGYTYDREGSIYYRISSFKNYGRLAKLRPEQMLPSGRVDRDEYDKENAQDFVLWKAKKEGEPSWETELGPGRPGWHLECSAMSMKYLGETFDLHTGGEDNIFPHHENEIAQSEAATGRKFVDYWMHCKFLLVNGEKMSKSKGNFFTLRDLLAKGYRARGIRYLLLSGHYRNPLNLTEEGIRQAEKTVDRLEDFLGRVRQAKPRADEDEELSRLTGEAKEKFGACLDDDLDMPNALAAVFELVKHTNEAIESNRLGRKNIEKINAAFDDFNRVLGIFRRRGAANLPANVTVVRPEEELEPELEELIRQREEARQAKDFARADRLRKELLEKGVVIEDTKDGVRWKVRK